MFCLPGGSAAPVPALPEVWVSVWGVEVGDVQMLECDEVAAAGREEGSVAGAWPDRSQAADKAQDARGATGLGS